MLRLASIPKIAALLTVVWLTGCEKPPQVEMDAAKAAVENARNAEAEKYATPAFKALQDSLASGLAAVTTQDQRFALLRDYAAAKTTLVGVSSKAPEVIQNARETKERIRKATTEAVEKAKAAIDTTVAMVARAPRGKESKDMIAGWETQISGMQPQLAEAQAALAAENFTAASKTAEMISQQAGTLQQEVGGVITKYEELKSKARGRRR